MFNFCKIAKKKKNQKAHFLPAVILYYYDTEKGFNPGSASSFEDEFEGYYWQGGPVVSKMFLRWELGDRGKN